MELYANFYVFFRIQNTNRIIAVSRNFALKFVWSKKKKYECANHIAVQSSVNATECRTARRLYDRNVCSRQVTP